MILVLWVPLSEQDDLGGLSTSHLMTFGETVLYNALNPRDAFESIAASLFVRTAIMAIKCFNKALQCKLANNARKINLRYALKSTETAVDLWKNLSQRDLNLENSMPGKTPTPITGETVIAGASLREIMQDSFTDLYLDLKPKNTLEAIFVALLVCSQKASWDCSNEARMRQEDLISVSTNLEYAVKLAKMTIILSDLLERHQSCPLSERLEDFNDTRDVASGNGRYA